MHQISVPVEKGSFYIGFRKAFREIYLKLRDAGERERFRDFANRVLNDPQKVTLYTEEDGNGSCPAGQCPDGMGGCVPCVFP